MKQSPKDEGSPIDRYLDGVAADKRAALEKLRKIIREAAPEAEECISYGVAAFRYRKKALAGFSASAGHCSFFPMSGEIVAEFAGELEGFQTSKGTIRFQPGKPIPAALVKKIVKSRMAGIDGAKR